MTSTEATTTTTVDTQHRKREENARWTRRFAAVLYPSAFVIYWFEIPGFWLIPLLGLSMWVVERLQSPV